MGEEKGAGRERVGRRSTYYLVSVVLMSLYGHSKNTP